MAPLSMILSDFYARFHGHGIIQRQIIRKWYKIELYLQRQTNRKSYMVYWTAPFSITLNNPKPRFQGQAIAWRWTSPKWLKIRPQLLWRIGNRTQAFKWYHFQWPWVTS